MAERNLIGYDNDQVSLNGMLGTMAFQDSDRVEVNNINLDTISGSAALSAISEEIASAAVDVFVYDTRNDSDGGAWRKRTQHTSWYNETLNTATRGSRREFPAVAVIIVTSTTCIIYDGDDPSLPMWMEFNSSAGQTMFPQDGGSGTHQSVVALNAKLVTCHGDGVNHNGGLVVADFLTDSALKYRDSTAVSYSGYFRGNISERNDDKGWDGGDDQGTIVSSICNDIAMTVLPGAPIDPSTGLPIPTIAVATEGGASFILDNGFVRDATDDISNSAYSRTPSIDISPDGYAVFPQDTGVSGVDGKRGLFFIPIPYYDRVVDTNSSGTPDKLALYYESAGTSTYPRYSGRATNVIRRNKTQFIADSPTNASGLTILSEEQYDPTQGMVDWITSDYNTGWMHGDIKGAFLSDTDATNVTGSELVTNGTFDSDVSGWTTGTSTITYNSGAANIARNSASNAANEIYQNISGLTIGQKYLISIKITALTNYVSVYFDPDGSDPIVEPITATATGTYTAIYTATQTSGKFSINATASSTATATVDDISMRVAELDRSVNAKGLQVFGTITKSPVATGAELVGYSGFSASNYLTQPYNSDLDFGTSDFSITCWFNLSVTGQISGIFSYIGDSASTPEILIRTNVNTYLEFYATDDDYSSYEYMVHSTSLSANEWNCVHIDRKGSVFNMYLNGEHVNSVNVSNASGNLSGGRLYVGHRGYRTLSSGLNDGQYMKGSLALLRVSHSAPSTEQIKKMYEDEKVLFQENAKCTLYGTSDAITALAYDDSTNLLHVGTSSGRSDFQGLRRINNTTTAVTTAISSSNGMIVEQ